MSAFGGASLVSALAPAARMPSRYESQKRRDWQTFVRYLADHRPPLVLRRCSGAHVLEFLRYLDRFGKTRVHAPPCPAYGVRATTTTAASAPCQCPLRQAWGSLDALVGRLRAAFDERHGPGDDASCCNPFAARAVRLYLRDVRDAQSRARGISYHKKKKKRKLGAGSVKAGASSSKNGGGMDIDADAQHQQPGPLRGQKITTTTTTTTTTTLTNAVPVPPQLPPLPPCLAGVPFGYCDTGSIVANGAGCYGGVYSPLLFNAFS